MVPVYIKKDELITRNLQISNTKDYTRMTPDDSLSDVFGDCTLWMEDFLV